LKVGGVLRHAVSDGSDPVNALDGALRTALLPSFPELDRVRLNEYTVRVIPGVADQTLVDPSLDGSAVHTAWFVRVTVQCKDTDGNIWKTVAVSRNIVSASWSALVDAIEYKRLLDAQKVLEEQPLARSLAEVAISS
jgi:2-isopropylmalate synthase